MSQCKVYTSNSYIAGKKRKKVNQLKGNIYAYGCA